MSDKLITQEELDEQHAKLMAGIESIGGSALEWQSRALKAEAECERLKELNSGLTRDFNSLLVRQAKTDDARLKAEEALHKAGLKP